MSIATNKAGSPPESAHGSRQSTPKKGERFRCQPCGMEVQVTNDCKCSDPDHVHFKCCGEEMRKA